MSLHDIFHFLILNVLSPRYSLYVPRNFHLSGYSIDVSFPFVLLYHTTALERLSALHVAWWLRIYSVFDNGYSALSLGPTVRHDNTFHQRQVLFVKKIQTGQVWLYRDPVLSRIINYT